MQELFAGDVEHSRKPNFRPRVALENLKHIALPAGGPLCTAKVETKCLAQAGNEPLSRCPRWRRCTHNEQHPYQDGKFALPRLPIGTTRKYILDSRAEADSKKSLIHNGATPDIKVDPETYAVTADGVLLVCEPADRLPMAQRYFLF